MQATIEANRQVLDEKNKNLREDFTATITSMMNQIKIYRSSPDNKDYPKDQDPTTLVPANKRAPPLEGGNFKNNGGMWTLKHETISSKLYELLTKTDLKVDTALDLKNLYNRINMCLNAANRL